VAQTLAALMEEGTGLGDPLVVSTASAWSDALAEARSRHGIGGHAPASSGRAGARSNRARL